MRLQCRFSGVRPHAGLAGRLISLLLVLLLLPSAAVAEGGTANYNPQVPPPIPAEHEAADDDYFSDAVFVGDSMMDDVEMLDLFPTANFVCMVGMSPPSVNWKKFRVKGSDELLNVFEVAEQYPHSKFYILLGGNSLHNKLADAALDDYLPMIEQFIETFPDSYIYVITPPPGAKEKMLEESVSQWRFSKFRDGLLSMAEEKGLYLLDFYALMVDDEGYMKYYYDCGDGQHPNNKGYRRLEELIRTHTVEYE